MMLACPRCGDLCEHDRDRCDCGAALTVKGNRVGRADRMLAVLRDGRTYSREEILERAPGPFFLTNNAAADLRRRGFDVQHRVKDGLHTYRLLGEAAEGERVVPSPSAVSPSSAASNRRDDGEQGAQPTDGAAQLALSIPRSTYEAAA